MNILFVANWKIYNYGSSKPDNLQPSDYICDIEQFWFFKYFNSLCKVDVIGISHNKFINSLEKKLHFIFSNILILLKKMNNYDVIIFHGTNGAMLFLFLKRLFRFKTPPIIVVDISSFAQASTSGVVFLLSKFVSKKIDYLIYHTSTQNQYFEQYFPWLIGKKSFVPVGVDFNYWNKEYSPIIDDEYCVCVGYRKRDWDTLIDAYQKSNIKEKLFLIGNDKIITNCNNICTIPFIPIDQLMRFLANAKFSIIPLDNYNYSFGQLTILQQMAIGLPIISADVYSVRDYIKNAKGVIKYKPNDSVDLMSKLIYMSNINDYEYELMSISNKEIIKNVYNEKNMATFFEKIIYEVSNKGKRCL